MNQISGAHPHPMNEESTTASTAIARPTWVRWRVVSLLVAFSFMTWFNRVSMPVAYDEAISKQHPDITPEAIGLVYSTFLFAYMLFMTPGGWLIDSVGCRMSLLIMGLGSGVFGALTSLAGRPVLAEMGMIVSALLVIRFLMGSFTAPIYPTCARVVSLWIPARKRAFANSLHQAAAAIGIALTFPLFGTLIDHFGWPNAFVISGGVTIFFAVVWGFYVTDLPTQHPGVNAAERDMIVADWRDRPDQAVPPGLTWLHLLRNSSLIYLTLAYGAIGYIEYVFFFWMRHYFEKVLHMSTADSRFYSTVLFLSLAVGMIFGGWLADFFRTRARFPGHRIIVPMCGMVLGGVFLEVGLFMEEPAWIVACLAAAIGAVGACEATVWTTAVELGGRHGGTAAGIANTGGNLGGVIAPILTPWASHAISNHFGLSEQQGWFWGITLGGLICALGAGLWLGIRTDRDRTLFSVEKS
jgi:sugar phosphate permease